MSRSLIQLVRFGALGVVTNVLGYVLYLGITYVGAGPKAAMSVLYCVGVGINFIGSRTWVFRSDTSMLGASIRYVGAYAVGYGVNYGILMAFVDRLGYPHAVVQAVAIVIVACCLYITLKFLVFREAAFADTTVK
nr:GtrA family protein [Rhizobium sp. Q54]